jgi:hypothetical protein
MTHAEPLHPGAAADGYANGATWLLASGSGVSVPSAGREWLCLPDGSVIRVVTIDGELVPWNSPRARPVLGLCACGAPRPPTARSCGQVKCIAQLVASHAS